MEQDFSEFRPSRLWKRLPLERRIEAAESFWDDEQSSEQQIEAVSAIATHMKFRVKSVLNLAPERRTKYLATLPAVSDTIAARALVAYHLASRRPMMGAFLDALGIAHADGLISDEQVPKPDKQKLLGAAADLATKFPADDVSLYLGTLISQDPDTWGTLAEAPEVRPAQELPTK